MGVLRRLFGEPYSPHTSNSRACFRGNNCYWVMWFPGSYGQGVQIADAYSIDPHGNVEDWIAEYREESEQDFEEWVQQISILRVT